MRSTDAITRAWQDRARAHEIDSVNGSRGNIGNIWFPIKVGDTLTIIRREIFQETFQLLLL